MCARAWTSSILLVALVACASPTPEAIYAPYLEAHRWMYATRTSGPGREEYQDHILIESEPLSNRQTLLKVHIAPSENDPRVGARQRYVLDFNNFPPRLASLETEGGTASFEPGLSLPNFEGAQGQAVANYASGHGFLAGRKLSLSWKYAPIARELVFTPAGFFFAPGVDLEFRTALKITDATMRLVFGAGVGLVRAEWRTVYATRTVFTLESFK